MRSCAKVVVSLLLLVSVPSLANNMDKGEVTKAIHAVNTSFMDAWEAGDAAAVAMLYTTDAEFMVPGMQPLQGREAIQNYIRAAMDSGLTRIELAPREIQSHGSNAHEIGTYLLKTADGDVADKGNYVVIWKRVNGKWRLRRDIANSTLVSQ